MIAQKIVAIVPLKIASQFFLGSWSLYLSAASRWDDGVIP
jgi:hypothetical protein